MGARENEWQIWQYHILRMKFPEFYLCNHNSCEIRHLFSRTSMRNFPWCYYRWFITSSALEKSKKRMQYSLNYSGTRVCPLKIKITQYLVDSVLRSSWRVRQHWRYHGNRVLTVMFFLDLHFGCVRFCFYFYLLDDYINLNSAEIW